MRCLFCLIIFVLAAPVICFSTSTQKRLDADIKAKKPVVIHVSVALADNKNQWIVPVPESIGNGQSPRTNLYRGALYGVKTYMIKKAGWKKIAAPESQNPKILEQLVLKKTFLRNGIKVPVYLVADAWNGKFITDTIKQFMSFNAGHDPQTVLVPGQKIEAGGSAHLICYIGHNALMDYGGIKKLFFPKMKTASNNPENDAIILACKSKPYFTSDLKKIGAHPLVLTTGLMAPEAYSLDAAIEAWIKGATDNDVRKAAAKSYHKYQNSGIRAAERLFGVE